MELIQRPVYQEILHSYKGTPFIKVLTGIRRCGKSSLLRMFAQELEASGIPGHNLLYIRIDSAEAPLHPTDDWLDATLMEAYESSDASQPFYILLDEIQDIPGWEHVVRRFYTEDRVDLYLTGSNAFLLSSDLATFLSGRYVEIPVYPLSFKEYLNFKQADKDNVDVLFDEYRCFGGMPGLVDEGEPDIDAMRSKLSSIRDTVLLNDVAKRFAIRDIDLLEKLVRYVYSTSGNLFSTKKIADTLTSAQRKTYPSLVDSFLNAMEKAFLVYPSEQLDLSGKELLRPLKKYYAPDTGLRNLGIDFARKDIGFQLESIVFFELKRRGWAAKTGKPNNGSEVDFVATKGHDKLYIQVCTSLLDEDTATRELGALNALQNSFAKMVLTLDRVGLGTTETGVQVVNLIDWLLG